MADEKKKIDPVAIENACRVLANNKIKVYPKEKEIRLKTCGIKLWGVVDFLKNHCGFRVIKEQ